MGNSFKELNSEHLKRPAVVLIKKPFATDAEMAHELRSLLFKTVPQDKKSVTRIVGTGKIKAVYFQPGIPGIPYIIDDYENVPYFDPKSTNYGLDIDNITISSKVSKDYFANICSTSGGAGSMKLSDAETAKNTRATDWLPNNYEVSTPYGFFNIFQTYHCWVFDPEWELPKNIPLELTHADIIKVTDLVDEDLKGNLNPECAKTDFAKTKIGKKLLKYNRVYRMYTIIVQEGIGHLKYTSKKDFESLIIKKKYGQETLVSKSMAANLQQSLYSAYTGHLYDLIPVNNFVLNINGFLPKGINNPIVKTYNPTKTFTINGINTDVVDMDYVKAHPDDNNSIYTKVPVTVRYVNSIDSSGNSNPYLEFEQFKTNIQVFYKELINAFSYFYRDYINGSESFIDSLDHIKRCVPLRRVGEDLSVYFKKVMQPILTAGRSGSSSDLVIKPVEYNLVGPGQKQTYLRGTTDYTRYVAIPGSLLSYYTSLFGTAKVANPTVTTSYYSGTKAAQNTTVLEFKYTWYRNIYLKYIKPRYDKIKACKNVVIRECTNNFVELLRDYGIDGEKGNKEQIVLLCDTVLFDYYTGFYILNETSLNETVSGYVNTVVYPEYLSEDIEALHLRNEYGIVGVSNKDVSRVVVSRQVMGKSTCAVSIKNNKRKYNIDNDIPVYGGELIFEPMDEVLVFLPSTNMELMLSFKGLVSSVEEKTDNGYHMVDLSCECPIKRLEMVRTNIKPSLSTEESENNSIHPFTVPEKLFDSIDQWGTYMMCQGLTYLHSMLPTHDGYNWKNKVYTLINNNAPKFYDPLLTYLWYKTSANISDQKTAANALSELMNKYVCSNVHFKGDELSKSKKYQGIWSVTNYFDPKASKKIVSTPDTPYSVDYEIYAQRNDTTSLNSGTIVAQILGTRQPAFLLGVSDIPLLFSDYQTNLSILLDTAEKYNFFLYSNRSGVVQFRPPQIDSTELAMKDGLVDTDMVKKTQDFSYYIHPDYLSEQITASYHVSTSDERLITWLPLRGEIHLGKDLGGTISCVIQNKPLSLKYGIKTQREAVISGVKSRDSLYIYGLSLMDRNNKSFRSAKATTMGFGDMDINRTVYSPTDNTLYLREGLILDYDAGNTFTAQSSLNWGRKNLFKLDALAEPVGEVFTMSESRVNDQGSFLPAPTYDIIREYTDKEKGALGLESINLEGVLSELTKMFKMNQITVAYFNQVKTIINYVKENPGSEHLLSSFMFNGYVWDGVSSISFEDLMQIAYDSKLAAYADFETTLTLISNDVKETKRLNEIKNSFKNKVSNYLVNSTGEYVCTIFSTKADVYKQVWVNPQAL